MRTAAAAVAATRAYRCVVRSSAPAPARHRYGSQTLEGTATFLTLALAASLSVLPPGSALALALSATALEHLSWRGLDNLSVPIGSYLLLSLLSGTPIGTAS